MDALRHKVIVAAVIQKRQQQSGALYYFKLALPFSRHLATHLKVLQQLEAQLLL